METHTPAAVDVNRAEKTGRWEVANAIEDFLRNLGDVLDDNYPASGGLLYELWPNLGASDEPAEFHEAEVRSSVLVAQAFSFLASDGFQSACLKQAERFREIADRKASDV